jgi:hypothetical protein
MTRVDGRDRAAGASFPVALVATALLVGCSRDGATTTGSASGAPSSSAREGLGNVMVQIARRFEIAGRAANANRFELAEFEAGEIGELFESDVPNADMPKEGPTAHIPAMAKAFLETSAPELRKAAALKDRTAFAVAFQHTASACNACHQASAKGFIQVPSEPGKSVPDLDPQAAPSAAPRDAR